MWFSEVCTLIDNEYASSYWSKHCGLTQLHLVSPQHILVVNKSTDHAKLHSICFFTTDNIKGNDINFCQDLLTIENSDLKVHVLHYANELLLCIRLSFQKLQIANLQLRSTCRYHTKNMLGKRMMTHTHCR